MALRVIQVKRAIRVILAPWVFLVLWESEERLVELERVANLAQWDLLGWMVLRVLEVKLAKRVNEVILDYLDLRARRA